MKNYIEGTILASLVFFIISVNVYASDSFTMYNNYSDGYQIELPSDLEFELSYSPKLIRAKSESFYVTISKEKSPYEDVDEYIDYYLNRFLLNENYWAQNNISFVENKNLNLNGNDLQIISLIINDLEKPKFDGYTYVTIKTKGLEFFRLLFKYYSDDIDAKTKIDKAVNSFKYFKPTQKADYNTDFKPEIPQNWSDETLALYNSIKDSDKLMWGIFTKNIYTTGIDTKIPELEQKLEYEFPVILSYMQLGDEFPTEFMQKNYDSGKIVELTYQLTKSNNGDLFGYNPNIDIYRGICDDEIRKFAKSAKDFGHPFLFRLNNEMNSDWTSYSGVINMCDPEIYIENWRRIYEIFEQENVDNAIWIFNPNDMDFPPCNWNNFIAYYPGNRYVHMIGLTGYNTGTYYNELMEEQWREFDKIYEPLQKKYSLLFGQFPWIITEFSSSSIGGNKVKWIENMFNKIGNYPNIKIAVWFDYADYDFRPEYKDVVSRPYWLDETEQTLEAFKNGLSNY